MASSLQHCPHFKHLPVIGQDGGVANRSILDNIKDTNTTGRRKK
ncbi:MAG: hypothetical protein PVH22_08180 [Desulfobacteraceae bacterium]